MQTIGEIIRKQETNYISGTTTLSKHVQHSMGDTLDRIDAYSNSKHISGDTDSLGRDKPFFNISTAAVNVWYRATDIDRSNISVRATKSADWIDSFMATIFLRDWMTHERFGSYLNEWGRVMAKYGSAVTKFVENKEGLHITVVPWGQLIVDAVDFDANPKIEIIELTEAQLMERVKTHGYDKEVAKSLLQSLKSRETKDRQKKDNKNDYIKLYEIHGKLSLSLITGNEKDEEEFVQQMHVYSAVGSKNGRKTEYEDFTLFSGEEEKDPYMISHLIKEDGRTLSKGAVEHLFEAQWMVNHSVKEIKDALDLASKIIFQTSDLQFIGRNVLSNVETGDILMHAKNEPLTLMNNQALNVVSTQNFAVQWKSLGNEITGVSEAMLGTSAKSGTAWKQTEALLQESHSLFELMIENKSLSLEDMLRGWIIPHLKRKKMNNAKEIAAVLAQHEMEKIDSIYIKNESINRTNKQLADKVISGQSLMQGEQEMMLAQNQAVLQEGLSNMGGQRFFSPSEVNWKEQFKDLEWELDIDISGESKDTQQALTTLNTALKLILTPGFEQNKKAQMIVGKILEMSGTMSPLEYNSVESAPPPAPTGAQAVQTPTGALPA